MNENVIAWMHDDITWCMDESCPIVGCCRNTHNMMNRTGVHSYAMFRETDECPIYLMEQNMEQEREEHG